MLIQDEKKQIISYYNAYVFFGITYGELGEFDNASYKWKALSVIDDEIIPVEFQSRATSYNNIGFFVFKFQKIILPQRIIFRKD
jgi:hypothetical protein